MGKGQATESVPAERSGAGLNAAFGVRRLHLAALDAVLSDRAAGLLAGLVQHGENPPVLRVYWADQMGRPLGRPGPWVEVRCHRVGGHWWFVVEATGEGIVPVDEAGSAAGVLAGILARKAAR